MPPKTPMEELLGPSLLTQVGSPAKPTKQLMKDKDLVLFYFSASWCPPCKAFSPILTEFYNACAKDGKLEIVYISSDRSIPEFEGYYKKMPWLSIPSEKGSAAIKNNLSQLMGIQGIPTLVVLDAKTGEFINATARGEVSLVGGDAKRGQELFAEWMAAERKPMSEASKVIGARQQNLITMIFMWFVQNPISIFALLYCYNQLKKRWNAASGSGEEDGGNVIQGGGETTEF